MDLSIFKEKHTQDIIYIIEEDEKDRCYYIWCETVYEVLRYSSTWAKIKPHYFSFDKTDAIAVCRKINNEKYNKDEMWVIGYE